MLRFVITLLQCVVGHGFVVLVSFIWILWLFSFRGFGVILLISVFKMFACSGLLTIGFAVY